MKYQKIKKKICKAAREGNLLGKIRKEFYVRWMKKVAVVMQRYWAKHIAVEQNKILFMTFQRNYTCNPKYICEEILKRGLPWKLVWVKDKFIHNTFPAEVEVVQEYSIKYFHALYSSGILIDNWLNAEKTAFIKKENQFYIETMHGSLGIKCIGPDKVQYKKRNNKGMKCGSLANVCISNSTFETNVYRSTFWSDNDIWLMGHARNDILFDTKEETIAAVRKKAYQKLNIPVHVKLVLYAPTFRTYTMKERLDAGMLIDYLEKTTGYEWRLLERSHRNSDDEYVIHKEKVINSFDYDDIQELMLIADIGITDYSSWIFDYMLTRKPGFIFAPDLERYIDSRGFYYPIETTPFPIAKNTNELIANLQSFDKQIYQKNIEDFLREKGCMEDGHAAERIVDELEKIISAKQKENP